MNHEILIDRPPERPANGRRKRTGSLNRSVAELISLLGRVGAWARDNESRVKRVFFVAKDGGFTLYAIPKTAGYDSELTRSLCDLTIQLAEDGYDAHAAQVPDGTPEEMTAYFDPAEAISLSVR